MVYYHHPSHLKLCNAARARPYAICWWCGLTALPHQWTADHVTPRRKNGCPLVAAHAACNTGRQGVLPDRDQLQRLFWDEDVVCMPSQERVREWCVRWAVKLFDDEEHTDIVIAACRNRPILRFDKRRGYGVLAPVEDAMARGVGLL